MRRRFLIWCTGRIFVLQTLYRLRIVLTSRRARVPCDILSLFKSLHAKHEGALLYAHNEKNQVK
jgi:hypothetical protein